MCGLKVITAFIKLVKFSCLWLVYERNISPDFGQSVVRKFVNRGGGGVAGGAIALGSNFFEALPNFSKMKNKILLKETKFCKNY